MTYPRGPERRGPERPGHDYPPEWDSEPTGGTCRTCNGHGSTHDIFALDTTCPDCDGDGEVDR